MPVIDGIFVPRTPLTVAEEHVDFPGHDAHIVARRVEVEQACTTTARRIGLLASQHAIPPARLIARLSATLEAELDQTARFGYAAVSDELGKLRDGRPATAGLVIPDAGQFGRLAAQGLAGVATLLRRRAHAAADAIANAAASAAHTAATSGGDALAGAQVAAARMLHNQVLELVGETLNLGRSAAAMAHPQPPEFALRSEQLDRNTCVPCDELHGTITVVGSPEFYAVLPPLGCLGGGRCRGVMVFGDGPRDVRQPEQQDLLAA